MMTMREECDMQHNRLSSLSRIHVLHPSPQSPKRHTYFSIAHAAKVIITPLSQDIFQPSGLALSQAIAVDIFVANLWMAVLLVLISNKDQMNAWLKADNSAVPSHAHAS